MPYRIEITREAKSQLQDLPVREQRIVGKGVVARVQDRPTHPSRAVKALRPNPLAGFKLRLGDLRVLYNVDEANVAVVVVAVGRKSGNILIIDGIEFHGHQTDPTE